MPILTQSNNIQMKLTVRELVSFGRFPYSGNHPTKEDQEMIDKAIRYMELEEFEDRFIDELSGGQRQRACIAMVIAQDTEYILLDEPTNNLDIYHATNMMKIGPPPVRRARQNGDSGAARNQLRGLLFRLYLRLCRRKNREIWNGGGGDDQGKSLPDLQGGL